MNQTWENSKKNLVLGQNLAHLAQIRAAISFFPKNLIVSVTRYHGQLPSCTISEKTNDPILRKLSDGWTDRWTDGLTEGCRDGQMDGSDFIGRCPTNIKRPKRWQEKT